MQSHEKCFEAANELKLLVFVFGKQGTKSDTTLINKISNAERPKDKKELSRFLGMANYYGRFIQNFAEICSQLHDAKKSIREYLTWDDRCEKSFNLLKAKLTSAPVLQPFSLAVDASQNAIGAVLSQVGHPVLYVSRKLSPTEANYSNIEREALAALWACKRLEQFLLGKKFILKTDHKPLYILGPDSALRTDISARLMRFALKMMHFDYEIKYIPGISNVITDRLSQSCIHDTTEVPVIQFAEPCIKLESLESEYLSESFLQDLKQSIVDGNWSNVSAREKPFKRLALQLSIEEKGYNRVDQNWYLHSRYKNKMIKVTHQSHNGIPSTLRLIQRELFGLACAVMSKPT